MQTTTIRRSIIRLAGIVAIMTGLVMSSGIASAGHTAVGLIECDQVNCAVVTIEDLRLAWAEREMTVVRPFAFPAGPFDPRFTSQ